MNQVYTYVAISNPKVTLCLAELYFGGIIYSVTCGLSEINRINVCLHHSREDKSHDKCEEYHYLTLLHGSCVYVNAYVCRYDTGDYIEILLHASPVLYH